MARPLNLQQKTMVFLLLPVAALLVVMATLGYLVARASLLTQWNEAAILKLQRAAHQVDMRLNEPEVYVRMFGQTAGEPHPEALQKWIVERLQSLDGVDRASLKLFEEKDGAFVCVELPSGRHGETGEWCPGPWRGMRAFQKAQIAEISLPRYNPNGDPETVSLISDFFNADNERVGQLEVVMRFAYLMKDILSFGWGEEEIASIIDGKGTVLTCSSIDQQKRLCPGGEVFGRVVEAMHKTPMGGFVTEVHSEKLVVGYHHLSQAPWTLVIMAPAHRILSPIYRFTQISIFILLLFMTVIIALIRWVVGKAVAGVKGVSSAAQKIARGDYKVQLHAEGRDEVAQLMDSFNSMVVQLEERMRLKQSLNLAMEVQQNLLPGRSPSVEGLDIAGVSVYCDETGGDYYDFIPIGDNGCEKLVVAVGDVAGHGIPAALLMTTARAMIRTGLLKTSSLGELMTDVNRLLCRDTRRTGDFMTLVLVVLGPRSGELRWVRAGHAPPIVYDYIHDSFGELRGEGSFLGLMETEVYREYRYPAWKAPGKILFMGTDGIWEAQSPEGEPFGLERLKAILRGSPDRSAQEILDAVISQVAQFRQSNELEDDLTMVVLKS